jgi:DnaK suppressor protein
MSQYRSDNFQALHGRLESLRQELVQRKQRVMRDLAHAENGLSRNLTEQAVEVQNDESLHAIDTATDAELAEVQEALRRMGEGEYGVCRDCRQPIAPLRLASLPQVVTCAACAR